MMSSHIASAIGHPNIALIKYWGNRDHNLRLPSNGSLSMTLGDLETVTQVTFDPSMTEDRLYLNENAISGPSLDRVSLHLDVIRTMAKLSFKAEIISHSSFPVG